MIQNRSIPMRVNTIDFLNSAIKEQILGNGDNYFSSKHKKHKKKFFFKFIVRISFTQILDYYS